MSWPSSSSSAAYRAQSLAQSFSVLLRQGDGAAFCLFEASSQGSAEVGRVEGQKFLVNDEFVFARADNQSSEFGVFGAVRSKYNVMWRGMRADLRHARLSTLSFSRGRHVGIGMFLS